MRYVYGILYTNEAVPRRQERNLEESRGGQSSHTLHHTFRTSRPTSKGKGLSPSLPATETSPLLGTIGDYAQAGYSDSLAVAVEAQLDGPTVSAYVDTTWSQEVKALTHYAAPLVLTFLLQYSIDITSVISAGQLGKLELGAVSCKLNF